MAVPPVGMESLAGQVVADGEAVPSEECTVPWVVLEPVGPEPVDPVPSVPKRAFLQWP